MEKQHKSAKIKNKIINNTPLNINNKILLIFTVYLRFI